MQAKTGPLWILLSALVLSTQALVTDEILPLSDPASSPGQLNTNGFIPPGSCPPGVSAVVAPDPAGATNTTAQQDGLDNIDTLGHAKDCICDGPGVLDWSTDHGPKCGCDFPKDQCGCFDWKGGKGWLSGKLGPGPADVNVSAEQQEPQPDQDEGQQPANNADNLGGKPGKKGHKPLGPRCTVVVTETLALTAPGGTSTQTTTVTETLALTSEGPTTTTTETTTVTPPTAPALPTPTKEPPKPIPEPPPKPVPEPPKPVPEPPPKPVPEPPKPIIPEPPPKPTGKPTGKPEPGKPLPDNSTTTRVTISVNAAPTQSAFPVAFGAVLGGAMMLLV